MAKFLGFNDRLVVLTLVFSCAMLVANGQSNIRTFTPSSTIKNNSVQVKWFNSLFTQTKSRGGDGKTSDLFGRTRESFFTSNVQFMYGASDRVNIGFDAVLSKAKFDGVSSSPLAIFGENTLFSESRLSYIGPSIKIAPVTNVPRLSYQSTVWFPLGDDLESPNFIADDKYVWFNRFFYDKELSDDFLIFFEADFNYRFVRKSTATNYFRLPVSVFLSYFPQDKLTFYTSAQYSPRFEKAPEVTKLLFRQWYLQLGFGSKYQLTSAWELELSYGKFVAAKNDGAGDVINFGLRYLK